MTDSQMYYHGTKADLKVGELGLKKCTSTLKTSSDWVLKQLTSEGAAAPIQQFSQHVVITLECSTTTARID